MKTKSFLLLTMSWCVVLLFSSASDLQAQKVITTRFSWPLKLKSGIHDPNFWYIAEYIDHDKDTGDAHVMDYNGGKHTYDGHAGTDIGIYPYAWKKVRDNEVQVIAAADGVIDDIDDGNVDTHCSWSEVGPPNFVKVKHADGSFAIYKHMKKNSVTKKVKGDKIARGEYLGIVASSGHSSGPHLHFAVTNSNGDIVDPWVGPGNPTTNVSLWQSQFPYLPSAINYIAISTQLTEDKSPSCPTVENTYEKLRYQQGDDIYVSILTRHEKNGDVFTNKITDSKNSIWKSWTTTTTSNFDRTRRHQQHFTIPMNAATGIYTMEVKYLGKTYSKTFFVDPYIDCTGLAGGNAYIDECATCVGGNTGKKTTDSDGDGVGDCVDFCPLDPNKVILTPAQPSCAPCSCTNICLFTQAYSNTLQYKAGTYVVYNNKKYRSRRSVIGQAPAIDVNNAWEFSSICMGQGQSSIARNFEVAPNPAQGEVTVMLNQVQVPVNITVYSPIGEELYSFPATEYQEDFRFAIEKIPPGFFFIRISGDNFSETIRVKKE